MTAVLETINLRKSYGNVHAVRDVSLTVEKGDVFGFLGPNGAGKTTTIGMILGLLYPTSGEVRLFGERVSPDNGASLKRVGALFGANATLVPYLNAHQHLAMVAEIYAVRQKGRIDQVLEQVGLESASRRAVSQFSTGMKQRLGLGMALLHNPDLLILDEPTNGMDPAGMREVRDLLRSLAAQGTTIFLSSHLLHEIEQVSNRVAILNQGRVVAQGYVSELLAGSTSVRVRVPEPEQALDVLRTIAGMEKVERNGDYIVVAGQPAESIVTALTSRGIVPSEITSGQTDLEDIYLQITREAA